MTEQLPPGKQNTGRPVLAGPIVTASGLLFIASTDDNRFRALDAKTGKELWVDEARAARQRRSDHVSGQERQAVRGSGRHRYRDGVRAPVSLGGRSRATDVSSMDQKSSVSNAPSRVQRTRGTREVTSGLSRCTYVRISE